MGSMEIWQSKDLPISLHIDIWKYVFFDMPFKNEMDLFSKMCKYGFWL